MTHIETLIKNEIENALENLERKGVGYIDYEHTNSIYYRIDNNEILIKVEASSLDMKEES